MRGREEKQKQGKETMDVLEREGGKGMDGREGRMSVEWRKG